MMKATFELALMSSQPTLKCDIRVFAFLPVEIMTLSYHLIAANIIVVESSQLKRHGAIVLKDRDVFVVTFHEKSYS